MQRQPQTTTPPITVVGIDVGGARKGFHAVALIGGAYAGQLATADVQELAHWCRSLVGARKGFHAVALIGGAYAGQLATADVQELAHWCRSLVGARVIAIDAPCRWSTDGRARPCERELMQKGIWCFSSPTHQKAHTPHRTGYFDWMLQGEKLYQALEASYPLVCRLPINGNACFETFPHAVTWHLRGGKAKAAQKRTQRRELLQQTGLDLAPPTTPPPVGIA